MSNKFVRFPLLLCGLLLATVGISACGDGGTVPGANGSSLCDELQADLITGAARGGIPAISDPILVSVGDPAAVPTYCLSRFARPHITVALTGEGGDEIFAGYPHHGHSRRLGARSSRARLFSETRPRPLNRG